MQLIDLTPSIPKQKMNEYIWVITGRNKVGKTTLGNNFPKPFHFKFEPSTSGLLTHEIDIFKKANELGAHPWAVYKRSVKEFVENDGYGMKTALTDPYGVAYDVCKDFICKRHGIDSPSDLEYGAGWGYVNDEFKEVTRMLTSNNFGVVIIAHMKTTNQKDGLGGEKDVVDLDIGGSAGKFIKNMADIFLLADFDEEGNRKIFVRPTTSQEAGGRLDFGVDKINLDFDELKEAFDKAVEINNEKQGVTQEMINDYYAREEKKEEKKELVPKVVEVIESKGVTPPQSREILSAKWDKERVGELNTSELKAYMELLKSDKYKNILE